MIDRSSYEPLYQQIKKDIEQQILDGTIKIGDKLMSETEMLRHYNVGRMTVRNALAELVSTGCLRKKQGCYVKYRIDTLPLLLHWKNMCSHDYVIGLEPSNSHIMGRTAEREHGTLPVLEGYQSCDFHIALGVLDGKEEIAAFEAMLNAL